MKTTQTILTLDSLSQPITEAYMNVPPEEGMTEIEAIISDSRHP